MAKKSGVWVVHGGGQDGIYPDAKTAQKHTYKVKGAQVKHFEKNQTDAIQKFLSTGEYAMTPNQKKAAQAQQNMVYVVRVGRKVGKFATKAEAEAQVRNYPGGQYKEFRKTQKTKIKNYLAKAPQSTQNMPEKLRDDTQMSIHTGASASQKPLLLFLSDESRGASTPSTSSKPSSQELVHSPVRLFFEDEDDEAISKSDNAEISKSNNTELTYPPEARDTTCVAYVDGSYSPQKNQGGAGIVLFYQGKRKDISVPYPDKDILKQYANFPCELFAVQMALYTASISGAEHVVICHDMVAISDIANDFSATNSKLAEEYRKLILFYRTQMRVEFRKVEGHADKYHNEADKLAVAASNIAERK